MIDFLRDGERGETTHRIALLAGISVLAGLLVAGVALPVVGGLGLVTKRGIEHFDQLPSELQTPPLPQRTRILAADGSTIATFYYENRISVPLDEIAPVMRKAIIAIEDARFYQHGGVDLKSILRAVLTNSRAGAIRQGGSTITQQYVKNALIEASDDLEDKQDAIESTLSRKLREARYALALEHQVPKDEILNRYLNIALFGGGAYGVEAAARRFFDKHASQLNLREAALLAGMVRNPSAYDPTRHPEASTARRDTVLTRMRDLGYIDEVQYQRATTAPLGLDPTEPENSCEPSSAPFFCDYVQKRFIATETLGKTREDRVKLLLRGGLTIRTTLQPSVQKAAQRAVDNRVPRSSPYGAAIAMVEPGTGKVRAIAQNRDFGEPTERGKKGARRTTVNFATDNAFGGSRGFQSGSTFKVFTLAAALEEGIPLGLRINSPASVSVSGFTNCDTGAPYPPYRAGNAGDSEAGNFNLLSGTWHSVNTFYVQLEQRVSQCKAAEMAERLGVRRADGRHLETVPSLTLGTNEVSPLAMANANAAFAAHGRYCPPVVITGVVDADGKGLKLPEPKCNQAIERGIADTVTSVLQGVITSGTGAGLSLGRPAAGKTGTVQDYASAWFVGYTPQLSSAVWVGHPDGGYQHPLDDVTINGTFYSQVYGATIPGPIWRDAMVRAHQGKPILSFPPASSTVSRGEPIRVPSVEGLSPEAALDRLRDASLVPTISSKRVADGGKAGTVAYTDPAAGARAYVGSSVVIYLTNGKQPAPTPSPGSSESPGTQPSGPPATPPGHSPKPDKTKPPKPN